MKELTCKKSLAADRLWNLAPKDALTQYCKRSLAADRLWNFAPKDALTVNSEV